ncbi:radical SAM protein [bacterium]|nr:radical SAM protein [bacterium]
MWFHLRLLEKCNLKCVSCYAQNHDRSLIMSFGMFRDVLEVIQQVRAADSQKSVIYLSGGEPLMHPQFFEFLDCCFSRFDRVSILTNGILVPKYVQKFTPYREKLCVQISLDGDETINDQIRGRGVYAKVVKALNLLKEHEIRHWISYTVSQANKQCYPDILQVAKETQSFFNNVTPYIGDPDQMLDYFEWKEFKYNFEKHSRELGLDMAHGPNCCGFRYQCGAFYSGVTINPDGSLAGCARINNVKGQYTDMQKYLLKQPLSITETCMKQKWGSLRPFDVISSLET